MTEPLLRFETCQMVVRVFETDYKWNSHKLYVVESESKAYKTVSTRFANKTQLVSLLKSYKRHDLASQLFGEKYKKEFTL